MPLQELQGMLKLLVEVEQDLDTDEFWKIEKEAFGGDDVLVTKEGVHWMSTGEAEGFTAHTKNWNFAVVEFGIEDQGFPPGSKGYDGTAHKTGTVLRLTRDLAKKAFNKIKEQYETVRAVRADDD